MVVDVPLSAPPRNAGVDVAHLGRLIHCHPCLALFARVGASASRSVLATSSSPSSSTSSPPPSCLTMDQRVERLHAELRLQQFPTDRALSSSGNTGPQPHPSSCHAARLLVFEFATEGATQGFSAIFQFLASALIAARLSNRTLVETESTASGAQPDGGDAVDWWTRAPRSACAGRKFGCYFEPLSECSVRMRSRAELMALPVFDFAALDRVGVMGLDGGLMGAQLHMSRAVCCECRLARKASA